MLPAALVLEGGALRSLYTSGVLDVMLDNQLEFQSVIGTSSGSLCGVNYLSKQRGRSAHININYCREKEYISLSNRFTHDSLFNFDFLFEDSDGKWPNFDGETYKNAETDFWVTATQCETGKTIYFKNPYDDEMETALRASCSMPVAAGMVETKEGVCLDGGITDSIPYQKMLVEGFEKIVVVRTREGGYRKTQEPLAIRSLYKTMYAKYPNLQTALEERPWLYNRQVEELEHLEKQGRVFIIEPQTPVTVGRAERNQKKLEALYMQGLRETIDILPKMLRYIDK